MAEKVVLILTPKANLTEKWCVFVRVLWLSCFVILSQSGYSCRYRGWWSRNWLYVWPIQTIEKIAGFLPEKESLGGSMIRPKLLATAPIFCWKYAFQQIRWIAGQNIVISGSGNGQYCRKMYSIGCQGTNPSDSSGYVMDPKELMPIT